MSTGVARRGTTAGRLINGGLAPSTPVAAVQAATTERETVVRCRLDELADADVEPPAVLVIGTVAGMDVRATAAAAVGGATRAGPPEPAPKPGRDTA